MSKYQPLSDRLSGHGEPEWRTSFADLEAMLGFPLPKTARSSGAWWANDGSKTHHRAWLDHGWAADVDRAGEMVVFRRKSAPASAAEVALADVPKDETAAVKVSPKVPKAALFGAVAAAAGLGALLMRAMKRR